MTKMETFATVPPAAVSRVLAAFDREQLAGFIAIAIDLLDLADGDPDLEEDDRAGETIGVMDDPDVPPEEDDGDPDLEQTMDEDDWYAHAANGPGCPIADAGGAGEGEDDEDDNPAEAEPDEEEDDHSGVFASEEETGHSYGPTDDGPGCIFSDNDSGHPNDTIRHRKRIQRDRCFPKYERYRDFPSGDIVRTLRGHTLINEPIAPNRRSLLKRKRGAPRRPRG